ncbi:hypothetical protein FRX31_019630, partial [Thalictrum thalictroides]
VSMEGSMWGYDLAAGCFTVMSLTDKSHVIVECKLSIQTVPYIEKMRPQYF